MDGIFSKYKKAAALSYKLFVEFEHVQLNDIDVVIHLKVMHKFHGQHYVPIILTTNHVNMEEGFHIAFMHICENFDNYLTTYACKNRDVHRKKKKVTFDDVVKVRLLTPECQEYLEYLVK